MTVVLRLLASLLVVAILSVGSAAGVSAFGGPAATRVAATGPLTAPGERPSAVILLGGLCSSLSAGALPGAFTQGNGLVARLRAAGWAASEILAFSYRGGVVDAGGRWVADPYECADTRERTIPEAAAVLDAQVRAYLAAHADTDVHVIGFSQGGLVAVAYLAHLTKTGGWTLPNGGRLASVVSLDSPLGGLPFVEAACGLVGDVCAASEPGPTPPSLQDMSTIWGTSINSPAGAERSIGRLFGLGLSNQSLATTAAQVHGATILTVGNVRDWVYAPIGGPLRSVFSFTDTQWLRSGGAGSRVYARVIDSGPETCPSSDASGASCNHARVLTDTAALEGVVAALTGRTPAAAPTCPAARGACLTLQPRPGTSIASSIAPGVVTSGTKGFTSTAVRVSSGSRVTVRFSGGAPLAGTRVEIWSRSRTGSYRFLTSRIADTVGNVRFYAPPVRAWTAYQARFPGSLTYGASVSPGRVADVR